METSEFFFVYAKALGSPTSDPFSSAIKDNLIFKILGWSEKKGLNACQRERVVQKLTVFVLHYGSFPCMLLLNLKRTRNDYCGIIIRFTQVFARRLGRNSQAIS